MNIFWEVYLIKSVPHVHVQWCTWFIYVYAALLKWTINVKFMLVSVKTLINSKNCSKSIFLFGLSFSLIGRFSPADMLYCERLSEKFSRSKAAFGTTVRVICGFLYCAASSLKRVSGRVFRISEWFQRTKLKPYFYFSLQKSSQKFRNHLLSIGSTILIKLLRTSNKYSSWVGHNPFKARF